MARHRSLIKKNLGGLKMNHLLTRMIIELHEKGFTEDFLIAEERSSLCLSSGKSPVFPYFTILFITQGYDQLTRCYQYVHAIETHCGIKGLLLSNQVFFNTNYLSEHKIDRKVIFNCLANCAFSKLDDH
jgi:hypothetical protein